MSELGKSVKWFIASEGGRYYLVKGGGNWLKRLTTSTAEDYMVSENREEAEAIVDQLRLHPEYLLDQSAFATTISPIE